MLNTTALAATAAALMLALSATASADDAEALAKSKNCFACHAVDKKLVGPSYKDVAAKYKGDATAPDKLAEKIQKGGSGTWGPVPMPPNAVTPEEAKSLATWVLSN